MNRYVAISVAAGTFDFVLALIFLHAGWGPWLSIGVAMVISGVADYFALEWWGFPHRAPHFSTRRLLQSTILELTTYLIRIVVLNFWNTLPHSLDATEHLVGLAVSYTVGGLLGYLIRTKYIFRQQRVRNASD